MARKRTSDTTTGAVSLFMDALKGPPSPPDGLRPDVGPFLAAIISAREGADWGPVDLVIVEQAAQAMADIAELRARLITEDSVTEAGRAHPAAQMIESSTRRLLSLMRFLGLAAVDARDNAGRNASFKRARRVASELAGDDLLAH